jgi:hypothetical protein
MWMPYWLVSKELTYAHMDGTDVALLWSFPAAKYGNSKIMITNIAIQITTLFSGGTPSIDIGAWTIATDAVTTGGTITVVDADEYIPSADITEGTAALYWAATGDWITAYKLKTNAAPVVITPADATVPCVAASGAASVTAGAARVLMQVVEIPTF